MRTGDCMCDHVKKGKWPLRLHINVKAIFPFYTFINNIYTYKGYFFTEMQQTVGESATRRLVVCYLESWAAYRAPPLAFTAGLLPKSCTHMHYAFAGLHPHTYAVTPNNEDYDVVRGLLIWFLNP